MTFIWLLGAIGALSLATGLVYLIAPNWAVNFFERTTGGSKETGQNEREKSVRVMRLISIPQFAIGVGALAYAIYELGKLN